jgi:hypothetical protein
MRKLILLILMPSFLYGQAYFTENGVTAVTGTFSGDVNGSINGIVSTAPEIAASSNVMSTDQHVTITIDEYELIMGTTGGSDTHGAVKLYDFPEGYIEITGILCDIACTNTEDGVAADTEYDFGLGSTETDGDSGTLDTETDYDVLGIVGGDLSTYEATIQSQKIDDVGLDGTSTAADLWLNMAYLDADVTAETTNTISGVIVIHYRLLGDY